jgi:hypothetical protein
MSQKHGKPLINVKKLFENAIFQRGFLLNRAKKVLFDLKSQGATEKC